MKQSTISSKSEGLGDAGLIRIVTHNATLNRGKLTVETTQSSAGDIDLRVINNLLLFNQSIMTAESTQSSGGNIGLRVNNNLLLFNQSIITTTSHGDQPEDHGGDLTIYGHPHLFLMDTHSRLSAKANAGHGGNIRIITDDFLNMDVKDCLFTQSSLKYLRISQMIPLRCGRKGRRDESHFTIKRQEMLRPVPTDLQFFSPVEY